MPFIQAPDLNIHYELAGGGENVVVLIHGNFASWRWWRPVLDRLPPSVRAYAPDLRGCGDTDRPADGYTVEQLAADLLDFMAALELPAVHLVGHSLGGAVALQFALDYPGRVRTLTLVAPAPAEGMPLFRGKPSNSPALLRLLTPETSLATIDAVYRVWRALDTHRPVLRQALMSMMPTLSPDDGFEALVDDAGRMSPEAVVGHLRALDAWNVLPRVGELRVPVLILWGKRDALIPRPALERMALGLPHGRLVTWADVGHTPQLEQPDRFARLLFNFIHENTPAGPIQPGALRRLWGWLRGRPS